MHTVEHPLKVFVLCITSLVLVFVSEATAQQQRPVFQAIHSACSGSDVSATHSDFKRTKDTKNSWAYSELKLPGEAIGCYQAGCYASFIDLSITSSKTGLAQYKGQRILIIDAKAGRPGLLEASDRVLFRSTKVMYL